MKVILTFSIQEVIFFRFHVNEVQGLKEQKDVFSFYYVGTTLMIPMFVRRVFFKKQSFF